LGNTSLREVPGTPKGARILAKCEWENPAGSIKDRVAYALLCDSLRRHSDQPPEELRILEYSGGNLAAGLSYLGHAIGARMRFVLSSASPASLLALLRERGAEIELVDKELGFLAVIRAAEARAAADPRWRLLYQHVNPVNVAFHEHSTGRELVEQLGERVPRVWVASIGTGGTLVGVMRALRRVYPRLQTIAVTPTELPYGSAEPPNGRPKYAGSGGLGDGIRQPFVRAFDREVDGHCTVSYPDALAAMAKFFDLTGVRIGSSAAANWIIAGQIASTLSPWDTVVTVFPCAGMPEEWERLGR
jgi:cysteine synthase A